MKLTKRLLSMLLVLCMVFSVLPAMGLPASAADTTIAAWNTKAITTSGVSADIYDSDNSGAKCVSEIAINEKGSSDSVDAYYASNWTSGKSVYLNNLVTSNYTGITLAVKLRGSGTGTVTVSTSTDGSSYTTLGSQKITKSLVQYTFSDVPAGTVSIKFTYAKTGSFYFGQPTLTGTAGTTTTLQSISAGTDNAEFTIGDVFVPATITGTYSDGSTKDVTSGCTFTGYDMSAEDIYTVNVTHTASGLTTSYDIMVVAPTTYTVTYHSAGSVYGTDTVVEGNAIGADKLPTPTVDGWTFIGWSTTQIPTAQDSEPALYAGTETVNSNLNLYAVYAKESTSESAGYKLVDTPTAGKTYLVVTSDAAGTAYALDASALTTTAAETVEATAVTITENGSDKYISTTDANLLWTFSGTVSSARFRSSNADGYYLKINGSGFAGSSTSTDVYWSTSYGLYGKSGSGSTSYYVKPSRTGFLSADTTRGSATSRVYLYEGGAAVAAYSNYTTNPGTMYTITWMANGAEYQKDTVAENGAVTAPAVDPTMDDTAANYYDFAGWSASKGGAVLNSFPNATANVTYYAVFTTHTFSTVNWVVEGTTVATESYRAGATPSYNGKTPIKASDDTHSYTFSGWDPEITAVSEEGVTITYTAVFTAKEITYAASLSIGSSTLKVTKTRPATSTLTRDGVEIAGVTPVYSSSNTAVATIDATGLITALMVGTTDITVTYTVGGKDYTATQPLTVVENNTSGGYTLMTQANAPTDWSGEYIFIGRKSGYFDDLNNLMILTPKWNDDGTAIVEDGNSINGSSTSAKNNASFLNFGFTYTNSRNVGLGSDVIATDTEYTASIGSAYSSEDTLKMISTGDNDAGDYPVLDVITSIDDGYAFEIELVDDVNMYYTIRVKGTSYYLANDNVTGSDNNGMAYVMSIEDGDEKPLWKIGMETELTSNGTYTPPIVRISSVYTENNSEYTRKIFFNPNGWTATTEPGSASETSRFRVYGSTSATSAKVGALSYGGGASYSLYLYGNPNPFNAQISYNGDKVTLTQHAEVQVGVPTITLDGALLSDIATEPNWSLVSGPTWSIVSASTSGTMAIDANTGKMTFSGVSADDYAIVGLSYVVHDNINNVNHTVSAQGMVVIIPADDTYTGIVFERASGKENEVSFEVNQNTTELPLDFYVKSDSDMTTVYNDGRTSTGAYFIDNANMTWDVAISSGGGNDAKASISNDGDGSATLSMIGFTEDAILTVTVSGVKANGKDVPSFTYMVYVKYVAATLTADSLVIDFSLPVKFDPRANDTGYEEATVSGIGTATTVGTATSIEVKGAGTATLVGNEITFTPTAILSKPVIFYYYIGDLVGTIRVIPATNVYYEDSTSGDVFTFAPEAAWKTDGVTFNDALQSADFVGASDNVYGYDAAYDKCAEYSMGSAHIATVGETTNTATVKFSFYGTGFDVISLTGGNSGCLLVDVYRGTATEGADVKPVKGYFVDTYYGYNSDDSVSSVSTDFYQIPVMKIDGLEYGQYTAVITAYYHPLLNHAPDESYQFVFDAVRIYDPCGTNADANEAYRSDGEANAHYISLRDALAAGVPEPTTYTVDLSADTTSIGVGGKANLTATLYADGAKVADAVPTWRNTQDGVATIAQNANLCTVTGKADGTTQVYATFTCPDGSTKEAFVTITVRSTSAGDQPASYSKTSNSGTRGVTCTTLDGTYANSYYTGSYTYENLSSQTGSTLLNTLKTLMTSTHTTTSTYTMCQENASKTDCQNGDGTVVLLYTSYVAAQSAFSGNAPGWNREHVWPQSLGGFKTSGAGADMHHIRPDDVDTNADRGNLKYGEVTSGSESRATIDSCNLLGGHYDSTYYEPLDNVKGDVARICLYVYTRYYDSYSGTSDITNVFSDIDTLLNWCELDPVDTWEMGRNVVVQNIQGNRNVFIDYPELAWKLFDRTVPSGMTTPSGNAASAASTVSTASAAAAVPYEFTAKAAGTPVNSNVVFIDGKDEATLEEYLKDGPANEVYLAPGQAIAFHVRFEATPASIQLGMKTIAGGTAKVNVTCAGSKDFSRIATATEMYYDITDCITLSSNNTTTKPIVITNNSDAGVLLSVTNLKWTTANSTAAGTKTAVFMTPESAQEALRVVDSVLGNTSEPEEPIDPVDPTDPDEPVAPAVKPEQFKDLDKNAWYYNGVVYAIENGLMNGVALDAFAPDGTLTRAMLVTVLYRQAGSPTVGKDAEIPFTDVARGLWYTDAIVWANREGIALGNSATTFAPDDPVTREQMVTFLWRFAGKKDSGQTLAAFADANTVAEYAELPMKWAVENGIINGDNGKLLPQDTATRAQIANIFMRYEKSLALSD